MAYTTFTIMAHQGDYSYDYTLNGMRQDSSERHEFYTQEEAIAVCELFNKEYFKDQKFNEIKDITVEVLMIKEKEDEDSQYETIKTIAIKKIVMRPHIKELGGMENQTCGHCQAVGVFLGLSRKDNKTILCDDCEQAEALEEYKNRRKEPPIRRLEMKTREEIEHLNVERKENEALIVKWERVKAYQYPREYTNKDPSIWRFEVPTGWVVDIDGQINFIPDPGHRWHIYQDLDKGV